MKKAIIAAVVCFLFCGATIGFAETSKPPYLNPQKKAYYKPMIGGMCKKCDNVFTFSGYQLENEKTAKCPYCKHEQNLEEACNRYGETMMSKKKK